MDKNIVVLKYNKKTNLLKEFLKTKDYKLDTNISNFKIKDCIQLYFEFTRTKKYINYRNSLIKRRWFLSYKIQLRINKLRLWFIDKLPIKYANNVNILYMDFVFTTKKPLY